MRLFYAWPASLFLAGIGLVFSPAIHAGPASGQPDNPFDQQSALNPIAAAQDKAPDFPPDAPSKPVADLKQNEDGHPNGKEKDAQNNTFGSFYQIERK